MSVFDLAGQVAIVTGGGTGIGKSIATEFARAGARVVVASRKLENLEKTVGDIKALGREAIAVVTDVRVPEQVDNMVKQAVDKFGKLDILVNNAGAGFPVKAEELSLNGWNAIISIDLTGVFLCSKAAAKVMIPQKKGKIINIASIGGIYSEPGMCHYSAAKAGVLSLTRTLATEWAAYNIIINSISPGWVETEGVRSQQILTDDKAKGKSRLELPGKAEDIAYAALFLASSASDHMSGENLVIKGIRKAY